jgi:polyhydroxybutyrate depolymerase
MTRVLGFLLVLGALGVAPAHAGVSEHRISSGGLERQYRLVAPGAEGSEPVPVVLVFHGYGQSVPSVERMSGFDAIARSEGFVVVYPYSVRLGWNAENCCGGGARLHIEDVGFVDDVLADLGERYRLDPRRIYATGISNGGIFAYYLACRRATTFAAVGPVAATLFQPCRPARRVSVIHVHGLEDRLVPFEGGRGVYPGFDWPPVQDGIDYWRTRDGCAEPTVRSRGSAVISTSRCAKGTAVKLITVADAGHQWPHEPIATTQAIWAFFEAHPGRS